MKRIVFLIVSLLIVNAGFSQSIPVIKISAFPNSPGAADANTYIAGVKSSMGGYTNYKFSMAQLAAYMNTVMTFDKVLQNGDITGRTAKWQGGGYTTYVRPSGLQMFDGASITNISAGGQNITAGTKASSWSAHGFSTSNEAGTFNVSFIATDLTADRYIRGGDTTGTVATTWMLGDITDAVDSTNNRIDSVAGLSHIASVIAGYGATASGTTTVTVGVDTGKVATRARVQKAVDSLNTVMSGFGSGGDHVISGYAIITTGTGTVTVGVDTGKVATRARVQKAVDSLNGVIAGTGGGVIAFDSVTSSSTATVTIVSATVPSNGIYQANVVFYGGASTSGYTGYLAVRHTTLGPIPSPQTPIFFNVNGTGGAFNGSGASLGVNYMIPLMVTAKAGTTIEIIMAGNSTATVAFQAFGSIVKQ